MNNKIYATNGKKGEKEKTTKVRVQHWAPGKKFKTGCPIPTFLVNEAKRMESKRLIYVDIEIPPENSPRDTLNDLELPKSETMAEGGYGVVSGKTAIVSGWLFCRKQDTVCIDNGVALAISRLAVALYKAELGWRLSL